MRDTVLTLAFADDEGRPDGGRELPTVHVFQLQAAGADVALLWDPEAHGTLCHGCLWSDPRLGPVVPTPLAGEVAPWPSR